MIIIQKASANEADRDDKGAVAWIDIVEMPTYEEALVQLLYQLNEDMDQSYNNWFRIIDGEKIINL